MGYAAAWVPNGAGGYDIVQYGTLPGEIGSVATAVNNLGDVIGHSYDGTFRTAVLFTAPGGIQDLSQTGIFDPVDINDHRVLIDHSFTCKRLDLDTMEVQELGVPETEPGEISYASSRGEAINESGQVAGSVRLAVSGNCDHQAARYTDGVGWEVLSGCGSTNSAWDMNDLGDIVMRLNVAPYVHFQGIGTFLIEDLIVAETGHWYVINGYGLTINNARQMAVPVSNSVTGEGGIILLTPTGAGDIDGDGDVDLADLALLLASFGLCSGDAGFNAGADFDSTGCIELSDLTLLLANFGS
jgi:hypothetical protein